MHGLAGSPEGAVSKVKLHGGSVTRHTEPPFSAKSMMTAWPNILVAWLPSHTTTGRIGTSKW